MWMSSFSQCAYGLSAFALVRAARGKAPAHTLCRGRGARRVYAVFAAIPPLSFLVSLAVKALVSAAHGVDRVRRAAGALARLGLLSRAPRRSPGRCTAYRLLSGAEVRGVLSGASLKNARALLRGCAMPRCGSFRAVSKAPRAPRRGSEDRALRQKPFPCGRRGDTGNSLSIRSPARASCSRAGRSLSLFTPPLVLPPPDDPAACFRVLSSHPVLSRRPRLVGFSAVGTKRGARVFSSRRRHGRGHCRAISRRPLADAARRREYSALV